MMPLNREGLFVHATNPVSTRCFRSQVIPRSWETLTVGRPMIFSEISLVLTKMIDD
jgi:hypothetical protein